jgi:flagellar motor switch protein FliG
MNAYDLTGAKKAAILLLTIDEELSKEILKELDEEDIEIIGREIAKLKKIPEDVIKAVHEEFIKRLDKKGMVLIDGETRFKELIKKSLGDEKAEYLLDTMGPKEGRLVNSFEHATRGYLQIH